jgi:hypothetical protein
LIQHPTRYPQLSDRPFPIYIAQEVRTALNIFQTFQYENQSLHWDGMTKKLYVKQFLKMDRINDYDKYIVYPDYNDALKGKR